MRLMLPLMAWSAATIVATLPSAALPQLVQRSAVSVPPASGWEIGPVIRGRNYSVNMPPAPFAVRGGIWAFDFPVGDRVAGHVHYVTFRPQRLAGTSRITVRYRIDAAPGAAFVPQEQSDLAGTVSLYFQQTGDDWRGRRGTQYHRWYAPDASVRPLRPGTHEMTVLLDDPHWVPVNGGPMPDYLQRRRQAWAEAARVGLVFGSIARRGHGVFATAPARFTLLSFRID